MHSAAPAYDAAAAHDALQDAAHSAAAAYDAAAVHDALQDAAHSTAAAHNAVFTVPAAGCKLGLPLCGNAKKCIDRKRLLKSVVGCNSTCAA
eukprot:scaffold153563_cov24-Tisochrysis_lutea.AAC.1